MFHTAFIKLIKRGARHPRPWSLVRLTYLLTYKGRSGQTGQCVCVVRPRQERTLVRGGYAR
jgi:hypothetical protein